VLGGRLAVGALGYSPRLELRWLQWLAGILLKGVVQMFPLLEVSGSAYERGQQHGVAAKSQVQRSITSYARLFAYCGISWADAQQMGSAYRDLIGNFDADLLAEIEGIARGSERHINEILALNARTELLPPSYPGAPHPDRSQVMALNGQDNLPDWGECTSLAVKPLQSATGTTLLAQNWDWLGAQRGALVLLRVHGESAKSFITLAEAGMLAKIGLNSHGFGVCLNILRSTDDGAHPGLPVHVLLRKLLECHSVDEAIALAARQTFGASSSVLCADATGQTAALEFSPRGLEVMHGAQSVLCHTNHFLAPTASKHQASLAPSLSTVPRLERITALTEQAAADISVTDLQRMLRDETDGYLSICRRPDPTLDVDARIETVASVIMDLGQRVMHVAPDVPSLVAYQTVGLTPAVQAGLKG
jgi:isopenicillin-N N-acyltransferase like protein